MLLCNGDVGHNKLVHSAERNPSVQRATIMLTGFIIKHIVIV